MFEKLTEQKYTSYEYQIIKGMETCNSNLIIRNDKMFTVNMI